MDERHFEMTVDFRANPAVNRLGIPSSILSYYWAQAEQTIFCRQMGAAIST
jgi:hypothetical protein